MLLSSGRHWSGSVAVTCAGCAPWELSEGEPEGFLKRLHRGRAGPPRALVVCRGFGDPVEGGLSAGDFVEDLVGGFGPDEGLGVVVPVGDPAVDPGSSSATEPVYPIGGTL